MLSEPRYRTWAEAAWRVAFAVALLSLLFLLRVFVASRAPVSTRYPRWKCIAQIGASETQILKTNSTSNPNVLYTARQLPFVRPWRMTIPWSRYINWFYPTAWVAIWNWRDQAYLRFTRRGTKLPGRFQDNCLERLSEAQSVIRWTFRVSLSLWKFHGHGRPPQLLFVLPSQTLKGDMIQTVHPPAQIHFKKLSWMTSCLFRMTLHL